jgi:hypothetical protein
MQAKRVVFMAVVLALASPHSAFPDDAKIEGLSVSVGEPLRVSFLVKDAFNGDVEKAIESGLPATFTSVVALERQRALWFDEEVGVWEFKRSVRFDSLKREYEVTLGGDGPSTLRTGDSGDMKRLMASFEGVELHTSAPLRRGAEYEVKVRAELKSAEPPFLLHYLSYFFRFLDLDTGWRTEKFTP